MTLNLKGKCLWRALKHRALSVRIRRNGTHERREDNRLTQTQNNRKEGETKLFPACYNHLIK